MKRAALLHRTFQVGVTLKGIDGVLETVGGLLLWFVGPRQLNEMVLAFVSNQLSRYPHELFAARFEHFAGRISAADPMFAAAYLLSHGITKVVLAIALLRNQMWAYPAAIATFGLFVAYEAHRWMHTHSLTLGVVTLLDASVVVLAWSEYRAQKRNPLRAAA